MEMETCMAGRQGDRMYRPGVARWLAVLFATVLVLGLSSPALAQDSGDEATPILLGQLATRQMANGEHAKFVVEAPEDTHYVITSGDDAEAAKFDLIVTDEDGKTVYDDVFGTVELDLDKGDYTLEAIATDDGILSLFVTAEIGDMTDDYGRSGDLETGGYYTEADVDGARYAQLRVPRTDYWQRVFVNLSGDEGDSFNASVSGEDAYASISDSSTEGPLTFWSKGGRYDIQASPNNDSAKSMTVVVLLSGPVRELAVGESTPANFSAGSLDTVWSVDVEEPGRIVTIEAQADPDVNADVDLDMAVSFNPTMETWTSYNSGTDEKVTFIAPAAGSYYVRLYTSDPLENDVPYTISATVGDVAPVLSSGQREWGSVEPGESQLYALKVDKPNQFVTILMASNTDEDVDLGAIEVGEDGTYLSSNNSSNLGASEMVAIPVSDPGLFEITVNGAYLSEPANYVLLARVESAGDIGAQWATDATASSQYGEDSYSAKQATGEPNVEAAADNPLAWASMDPDGGEETIELIFDHPVRPTGVNIYESFNPGAITRVEAQDLDSEAWETLWEGDSATDELMQVFSPSFDEPSFHTQRIRLTLDTSVVPGWNEIDAVQLLGAP